MGAQRNNNFTEKQLRGIDLIVKGASKKFPFIKGWGLSDDYKNYNSTLYINLFIDYPEMAKSIGYKVNDLVLRRYTKGEMELASSALSPYLSTLEGVYPAWGDEIHTKIFDDAYELNKNIKNTLNKLYENLPEGYVIKYETTYDTGDKAGEVMFDTAVSFSINNYIQYK